MSYKKISPLTVAEGGTAAITLTQYNLIVGNVASAVNFIAPSATSGVPLISAGSSADPSFGTAVVAGGGTGVATTTAYAVLCGGTTSTAALQSIASVGTAAQVLTSNGAGVAPTFQAAAGGGLTWNEETGTSEAMLVDNGYISNNASTVTFTLPTTAALGSIIRIVGKGAGVFVIAQNANEIIHFGTSTTTTGAGGTITSTEVNDAIEIVCIVADTEWAVISSIGNLTVA